MPAESPNSSLFPRTNWAELDRAAAAETEPLDGLIRRYWHPLRVFLLTTFPGVRDQADLLLQDFAQDKMLKEGWLRRADQNRGRFRDFLKSSLRNFVLDRLSRAEVKNPPVSLDDLAHELPLPEASAEAFDLAWAQTVLAEALKRMEADCRRPGVDQPRRGYIWGMFQVRLLEPIFSGAEVPAYDELITRFDLKSPTDASNTLLSAKRIFKAHLGRVIKEYAGQDAAAADELHSLEEFLLRLAGRG